MNSSNATCKVSLSVCDSGGYELPRILTSENLPVFCFPSSSGVPCCLPWPVMALCSLILLLAAFSSGLLQCASPVGTQFPTARIHTDNLTAISKIPMLIVTLIFVGFLVYHHVQCLSAILHLHSMQCNSVEIPRHNSSASAAFLQDLCLHYFLLTYHNPVSLFSHNLHCRTHVLFCKTGKPTSSDEPGSQNPYLKKACIMLQFCVLYDLRRVLRWLKALGWYQNR